MYYYLVQNLLAASFLPDLPFPAAEEGVPALFLLNRDPEQGPAAFRAAHANQLTAESVNVSMLDPTGWSRRRTCRNPYVPRWMPAR